MEFYHFENLNLEILKAIDKKVPNIKIIKLSIIQ